MSKVTVLYAEDNPRTASLVKAILERNSFGVTIAPDGEKAVEQYRANIPDLLLLDIEMPEKTGLEIISIVRSKNRQIPIVLFSSFINPVVELEAISMGADDCIRKDCSPELFVAKLNSIIRRVYNNKPHIYQLSETTTFNSASRLLYINNRNVELSTREADLLKLLCVRMNDWVERDYLIIGLWGEASLHKNNILRKLIAKVRKCLSEDGSIRIVNRYGEAYSLILQVE